MGEDRRMEPVFKIMMMGDGGVGKTMNTMTSSCFRGAHAIILVYDITDETTFSDVHNWLLEINKHGNEDCEKMIIANKTDLEDKRAVSTEQGKDYAESLGLEFIETSALNGENVDAAFDIIARKIL